MRTVITAAGLAVALAACSNLSANVSPPTGVQSDAALAPSLTPDAACPPAGPYTRGKVSATAIDAKTLAGGSFSQTWVVVFKDQPSKEPPVKLVPKLIVCGAPAGRTPKGTVGPGGTHGTKYECSTDRYTCTVTITSSYIYTAPATLPGNKPWRYDLVRFVPTKLTPPYGPLPAAIVEIRLKP